MKKRIFVIIITMLMICSTFPNLTSADEPTDAYVLYGDPIINPPDVMNLSRDSYFTPMEYIDLENMTFDPNYEPLINRDDVIDQYNHNPNNIFGWRLNENKVRQSFIPSTYYLTRTYVYCSRDHNADIGWLKLSIKDTSDNILGTGLFFTNQIDESGAWLGITYPDPISVIPGNHYYIELQLIYDQPAYNYIYWWTNDGDQYPRGQMGWYDDGDWDWDFFSEGRDSIFETWGFIVTLEEAVDNTDLTFTTGGDYNWFGQRQIYYYGNDAAQSGDITHDQNVWMSTTVDGPGSLSFYWKVSSESNYDFLKFYIDSTEQTSISGEVGWQQKTYNIGEGTHDLKWKYTKDASVNDGSDCGWLDKIAYTQQENQPPNTPSNPNPSDGATSVSITKDLSWTGGDPDTGDTVTYDVYFGTSSSPPQVVTGQSGTTYDPGIMNYNTDYYWKIVAWDNHGASTTGSIWDFTTMAPPNNPPYTPSNPNPDDGSINVGLSTLLQWDGGDPEGDPVTYDVYFGTNNPPPQMESHQHEKYYIPDVDFDTTYYWKIMSWDDHDNNAEGPVWRYTTKPISYTVFKPLNATGNMDYPNPYTNCYHENHTTIIPGSNAGAISAGNNIGGSIGGDTWGWNSGSGSATSLQNITFYVGRPKSLDVHAELIISIGALEQWGSFGGTTLGHVVNNIEYLVDHELNSLLEDDVWEIWLWQVILNIFGFIPGGIGETIAMLSSIIDYIGFLQQMETLIIESHSVPYSIDFGCSVSEGYNTISIGGKTSGCGGWNTYGNTSFGGIVANIAIDGIAPPGIPIVDGPTSGYTSESYEFSVVGYDPNNDQIQYGWDWNGDGNVDDWTDFEYSEFPVYIDHTWYDSGEYTIKVKSRDIDLMESDFVNYDFSVENRPPGKPTITGTTSGEVGQEYDYTFVSTEPDGDDVYYDIDWADGQYEIWIGPYSSGAEITVSHAWDDEGIYVISAVAKDSHDVESNTGYLSVTMPQDTPQPCFLAGTQIAMADERFKNIEDLIVGDIVLSCDRFHGITSKVAVTEICHHSLDEMGDYYLIINNDLMITPNHLLFINGIWKAAEYAIIGDNLLGSDGQPVHITSIEQVYSQVLTYNFAVVGSSGLLGTHTFFAQGSLVTTKKDIVPVLVQEFILHNSPSYKTLLTV